jgi:hypothetical protein
MCFEGDYFSFSPADETSCCCSVALKVAPTGDFTVMSIINQNKTKSIPWLKMRHLESVDFSGLITDLIWEGFVICKLHLGDWKTKRTKVM